MEKLHWISHHLFLKHSMFLWTKVVLISLIVAGVSHIAGKRPVMAGFVAVLPFVSVLSLVFAYAEGHDMDKINHFAVSALRSFPLSMTFFVPFAANRWLKMSFLPSLLAGLACLVFFSGIAYYMAKR